MSGPQKHALKTITYTLTCPHVFGDDKAHEIVTYWKKPSDWSKRQNHSRICYLVEVDGKEFSEFARTGDGVEQIYFATITLDRP